MKHEGSGWRHTAKDDEKTVVIEEDQDTDHLGLQTIKYIIKAALKLLSNPKPYYSSPSNPNTNTSSPEMESYTYKSPDIMWYYPCDKLMGGRVNANWKSNMCKQDEM